MAIKALKAWTAQSKRDRDFRLIRKGTEKLARAICRRRGIPEDVGIEALHDAICDYLVVFSVSPKREWAQVDANEAKVWIVKRMSEIIRAYHRREGRRAQNRVQNNITYQDRVISGASSHVAGAGAIEDQRSIQGVAFDALIRARHPRLRLVGTEQVLDRVDGFRVLVHCLDELCKGKVKIKELADELSLECRPLYKAISSLRRVLRERLTADGSYRVRVVNNGRKKRKES